VTQTVTGALARRDESPVKVMWARRGHLRAVLPASVDVEAFLGTAAGALYASPDLMAAAAANPDSLMTALMRCASLGHLPGTDEFYLTPRKIKGKATVQGLEGYRGIIERMYRSGAVAKVVVREVCAGDEFSYIEGVDTRPRHGVNWFGSSRGQMIGVYAYAELVTGAVSRVVILNRADVMAARDSSDAKDSSFSPWNRLDGGKEHPELAGRSMWWKTAARRLEPWVPTSAEYRREQLRAAAQATAAQAPEQWPVAEYADAEIVPDAPAAAAIPASGGPVTAEPPEAGDVHGDQGPAADAQTAAGPPGHGPAAVIRQHFLRLGYDDNDPAQKAERLKFTARLAGSGPIRTTSDLNAEQARKAAAALEQCKDFAALLELVKS